MSLSRVFAMMLGLLLAALICIAFAGVYFYFEPAPLVYGNLPFPVLTSDGKPAETAPAIIHRGEPVPLKVIRCSRDNRVRTYVLSHLLIRVDGKIKPIILPANPVPILPGCTESLSLINIVPSDPDIVPDGEYYVEGIAEIQGTIKTHLVGWRSVPFEVR